MFREIIMSKVIEVSDEQYQALLEAAAKQHESVERFVERIADAVVQAQNPVYYTVEEMFDALDTYAAEVDARGENAGE